MFKAFYGFSLFDFDLARERERGNKHRNRRPMTRALSLPQAVGGSVGSQHLLLAFAVRFLPLRREGFNKLHFVLGKNVCIDTRCVNVRDSSRQKIRKTQ
jgi:hypothetical protein